MKKYIEFQEVGKETPYRVPAGFFEQVSEKTLLKAMQREHDRKRTLTLVRTFAVAASLAAMAFLGYLKFGPEKPDTNLSVKVEQPEPKQPVAQSSEIVQQASVTEINKTVPEKSIPKIKENENMNAVLADLSDDELAQLAAMYKSDPFISESTANQ